MSYKLPHLDKLQMIGQPYHGLYKSGTITLPNGTTKAAPTPANGGVVLIRVPGMPAVTRTAPEIVADTAAGLEWRNYALISGGYYGGLGPLYSNISYAHVIFVDAANVRWLMKLTTDMYLINYMTVQLKRIGHIDTGTDAWSSAINVTIPATFVASVHNVVVPLVTITQNTTGREFVIGGVINGGYANGLLKVGCTGTVNLSAADFGLTWTSDVIDYQDRLNHKQITYRSVNGTCVITRTATHVEYQSVPYAPTGRTATTVQEFTDGVVTRNDPQPAYVPGYTWLTISNAFATSSTKTLVQHGGYTADKYIWAAYVEDVLKLYKIEYSVISAVTANAVWLEDSPGSPTGEWIWTGPAYNQEKHLKSIMGAITVHDHSASIPQGVYGDSLRRFDGMPNAFIYDDLNGYLQDDTIVRPVKLPLDTMIADHEWVTGTSPLTFTVKYMLPIKPNENRWSSPLMVLCTRTRLSTSPTTYNFTSHSVWAPTGVNVATTTPIADLFATWHPVLNDLRVDTQNICWF